MSDDAGDVDSLSLGSAAPKADLTLQLRVNGDSNIESHNNRKEGSSVDQVSSLMLVQWLKESLFS